MEKKEFDKSFIDENGLNSCRIVCAAPNCQSTILRPQHVEFSAMPKVSERFPNDRLNVVSHFSSQNISLTFAQCP